MAERRAARGGRWLAAERLGGRYHAERGNELGGSEWRKKGCAGGRWLAAERLGGRYHAERGNELGGRVNGGKKGCAGRTLARRGAAGRTLPRGAWERVGGASDWRKEGLRGADAGSPRSGWEDVTTRSVGTSWGASEWRKEGLRGADAGSPRSGWEDVTTRSVGTSWGAMKTIGISTLRIDILFDILHKLIKSRHDMELQ